MPMKVYEFGHPAHPAHTMEIKIVDEHAMSPNDSPRPRVFPFAMWQCWVYDKFAEKWKSLYLPQSKIRAAAILTAFRREGRAVCRLPIGVRPPE